MATSLNQQVPGAISPVDQSTAATTTNMPWKSYDQYFRDKGQGDEAAQWSNYHSTYLPGETADLNWGPTGNPYRFAEEYNQYRSTLPQQYQDLINYGINPADVASGKVTGIMGSGGTEKIQLPVAPGAALGSAGTYGTGSGSRFSLDEDVLRKMWR